MIWKPLHIPPISKVQFVIGTQCVLRFHKVFRTLAFGYGKSAAAWLRGHLWYPPSTDGVSNETNWKLFVLASDQKGASI